MKQISKAQIDALLQELMALNIPVKSYAGIQDMLAKLPEVEEKKK
jgi:hypothetical protein